jgi:hypothetical protein
VAITKIKVSKKNGKKDREKVEKKNSSVLKGRAFFDNFEL